MKKMLLMIAILAITSFSGFADSKDLLSIATKGAVNKNTVAVKQLSPDEMKNIVGGLYQPAGTNIAWGVVQAIGSLTEDNRFWVVSEKYAQDLRGGFRVYLAYKDSFMTPLANKETDRGRVYNVREVPINTRELSMLESKYADEAKRQLVNLTPRYLQ